MTGVEVAKIVVDEPKSVEVKGVEIRVFMYVEKVFAGVKATVVEVI
jgi:hypothetical protein